MHRKVCVTFHFYIHYTISVSYPEVIGLERKLKISVLHKVSFCPQSIDYFLLSICERCMQRQRIVNKLKVTFSHFRFFLTSIIASKLTPVSYFINQFIEVYKKLSYQFYFIVRLFCC